MTLLITAARLAGALASDTPPVVLDVRYVQGGPHQRSVYIEGHLPGAVFVDLDADLAGEPGSGGRHPLPDVDRFGAAMRAAGVSEDRDVVVLDGGVGWAAARAWWLLRWAGHRSVQVLDGQLPAWEGPMETGEVAVEPGDFVPRPGALPLLDADGAAELAVRGVLLDARAGERYRGETEPIDKVAGHIPGAVSAPTAGNVASDGRLRPTAELAERFHELGVRPGREVGVYCGSGVSAAQEVLALEAIGITAALYVGSWSEWSRDPSRPVATGPGEAPAV